MKYDSIYSINLDIIEKLGGDKTKKFDSVYSEARYIAEDLMGAPIQKWDSIYQILLWILDNYEPTPPEPTTKYTISFNIGDAEGTAPEDIKAEEGEVITLPYAETFEKPGYDFTYWRHGEIYYQAGDEFTVTEDYDFVAVYELKWNYEGLTFVALEDGAIAMNHFGGNIPVIEYSTDAVNWNSWDGSEINVDAGTQVGFKGTKVSESGSKYSLFATTGNFTVSGKIVSLLDDGECTLNEVPDSAFTSLFSRNTGITDVSEIIIPGKVGKYSLQGLFKDTPNITKAPALPAAVIPNYAYWELFRNSANVNYIKCLATSISSTSSSLNQWVNGVASEGTFVQNIKATFWKIGVGGIPTNWVIVYYDSTDDTYWLEKERVTQCDEYGNTIPR